MNSLNIAATGLNQAQRGLGVVSQNVSNVNTEGYHKQRLELMSLGHNNNGVAEQTTKRYSHYLEQSMANTNAKKSFSEEMAQNGQLSESILMSESTQKNLNDIMSKFNDYSLNPSNDASNLLKSSIDFAKTGIQDSVSALKDQEKALGNKLEIEKTNFQNKITEFNQVQDDITKIGNSGPLLDRRDQLIMEMSNFTEINITKDGSLKRLSVESPENFKGGKLGGISDSIKSIQELSNNLTTSLSGFEDELNKINSSGIDGNPLINEDGSLGTIKLDKIVTGDIGNIPEFEKSISDFSSKLNSFSINLAGNVNADRQSFQNRLGLQEEMSRQIQSKVGVNLDEEAIDKIRYEQMYQSMAKIITADEKMFQSLLGAV